MQIAQDSATATSSVGVRIPEASSQAKSPYADYKVIRRNGAVVGFEPLKARLRRASASSSPGSPTTWSRRSCAASRRAAPSI
jgi:hypothetical protein